MRTPQQSGESFWHQGVRNRGVPLSLPWYSTEYSTSTLKRGHFCYQVVGTFWFQGVRSRESHYISLPRADCYFTNSYQRIGANVHKAYTICPVVQQWPVVYPCTTIMQPCGKLEALHRAAIKQTSTTASVVKLND